MGQSRARAVQELLCEMNPDTDVVGCFVEKDPVRVSSPPHPEEIVLDP